MTVLSVPTWVIFLFGVVAGHFVPHFLFAPKTNDSTWSDSDQASSSLPYPNDTESTHDEGLQYNETEEGEEENDNLDATVGIVIVLVLIGCSIGFELIRHQLEHAASKRFEKVVDALFGEMTVLGFLSLCTFCVVQTGVFSQLSNFIFGDQQELQESFEIIHFSLFLIMVIYMFSVAVLIKQAKLIEKEWQAICQLCHEPSLAERIAKEEAAKPKTFRSGVYKFFFPEVGGKDQLLLYYGLRKEFVLERQLDPPFLPKDKDQRLESSFNFSMYLSRCLEKTLGHIVEVHLPTWLSFVAFSVLFYGFGTLVHHNKAALSWAWVAVEWFAFLFCCFFHHHLCTIKQAMGWKISDTHSNALEDTHLLVSEAQLPAWCRIPMDREHSKKRNRQQMLFWFQEHGPEAYLIILQINLVFTGIYWAMLVLVYFPYMFSHEPVVPSVLYAVLAAAPFLLWTRIAKSLVSSITQVSSIGYLRKHDAVANVIRDQKVEAMIRAFLVLRKVLCSVESAIKERQDATSTYKDKPIGDSTRSLSTLTSREVERTFNALDKNSDGVLEPKEFAGLLNKLGIPITVEMSKKIVQELDIDGDGFVSKDEFIIFYEQCVVQDKTMPTPKEKAEVLFEIFDADGSGEITTSEFKETLEAFSLGFTLEDIGELLRELDEDGSGTISLHEFETLVKKYFPKETSYHSTPSSTNRSSSFSSFRSFTSSEED